MQKATLDNFIRNDLVDIIRSIKSIDLLRIDGLLEGLKQQTLKTKWITAEIDRITALFYFIVIISLFIVATQVYPVFLEHFTQVLGNIESTRLVILIFSVLALSAVIIMVILRIRGLQEKAAIVFRYLTTLEAIKTDGAKFKTTLQDIERYLNDNDWTL